MKIRKIKYSEASTASQIVGRNYSKKYASRSRKEIEAMFKNHVYKPEYIIAEDRGKILGFAGCIESWMDYSVYQIFWVNVLPEYQMKGIGSRLVKTLLLRISDKKEAKFVLISTDKPLFYKKFGFRHLAKLESGYSLMMLDIRK